MRAPVKARHPRRWPWLLLALLMLLAGGGLLLGGLYVYESSRILPGVHTLGVQLGGQQVNEATAALARNWDARQIVLEGGDEPLTLRPASLGIILDAEATALAAYRQGRNIPDVEVAIRSAFGKTGFTPTWYFDPAVAEASLRDVAAQVNVAPVNAGVRFVDDRVEPVPPVAGREVDVAATLAWLQQNASHVILTGRLPLATRSLPPAIEDVSAVVAKANQLLARPITLHVYDPIRDERHDGVVPPEVWTKWLSLEVDAANPGELTWHVDPEQAETYLAAQATAFGAGRYLDTVQAAAALSEAIRTQQDAIRLRLYHHPQQYTVRPGETLSSIAYDQGIPYPWIQQANPGLGDGFYVGQTITIPSPDELLPLPIVENKRVVVSISDQRMWAYENGALKWEWPVSTGIDSSPTAPGIFQVQSHEPNAYASSWDLWMPNFMGIYRPVPSSDFMNGFHGFPTRNGSNLLWTNSLGHKVTYGCILVSNDNVSLLYDWAEEGVIVEVRQ